MRGKKDGLMARLTSLLERKKTGKAGPAEGAKASFESWMPVAPDTEKLQAAWRLMSEYGTGIREIRGELAKAKKTGNQEDADSLEFVLGMHEKTYQKLAACFQSIQVNEDYRTSNEFEIVAADAVKLLESRYWPQEFIAAQFDDFNFLLGKLCARCGQKGGDAGGARVADAPITKAPQHAPMRPEPRPNGMEPLWSEGFNPDATREVLPVVSTAIRLYVKDMLAECRKSLPKDDASPATKAYEQASERIDALLLDFLPQEDERRRYEGAVEPELRMLCRACGVKPPVSSFDEVVSGYYSKASARLF